MPWWIKKENIKREPDQIRRLRKVYISETQAKNRWTEEVKRIFWVESASQIKSLGRDLRKSNGASTSQLQRKNWKLIWDENAEIGRVQAIYGEHSEDTSSF